MSVGLPVVEASTGSAFGGGSGTLGMVLRIGIPVHTQQQQQQQQQTFAGLSKAGVCLVAHWRQLVGQLCSLLR